MKNLLFFIVVFLVYFVASAQERHCFKVGEDVRQIPIDYGGLHTKGLYDIIVRHDTIYCLEEKRIHILPLNGSTEKYIKIPLRENEHTCAICFVSNNSIAVAVQNFEIRKVAVLLLSVYEGKVIWRIDYPDDLGYKTIDQSMAYIQGKLYIPVDSFGESIFSSFLIIDVKKRAKQLIRQGKYFEKMWNDYYVTNFCDSTFLYSRLGRGTYETVIIDGGKKISIEIKRDGFIVDIPFKLDCNNNKIWYWEVKNDSLVINSIRYK
jgi:hypothetical protein